MRIHWVLLVLSLASLAVSQETLSVLDSDTEAQRLRMRSFGGAAVNAVGLNAYGTEVALSFPAGSSAFVQETFAAERDYSAFDGLMFTIENTGLTDARMLIRMMFRPTDPTKYGTFAGTLNVPPGSKRRFVMWFKKKSMPMGLGNFYIADLDRNVMPAAGVTRDSMDLTRAWQWSIYNQNSFPSTIRLSEFSVLNEASLSGLIDRFGQSTYLNSPGKIFSDEELINKGLAELDQLNTTPPIAELTGTTKVPPFGGAPKWRRAKSAAGNWFLVHPSGRRFWAFGVNSINFDNETRLDDGRLDNGLFQELPEMGDNANFLYNTRRAVADTTHPTFSFYRWNLYRKFGADYINVALDLARKRLPAWGFNLIGIPSRTDLIDGTIPYTRMVTTRLFPTKIRAAYTPEGSLPDVFDPAFRSYIVNEYVTNLELTKHHDDPNFMGVYVDNEFWWIGGSTTNPYLYFQIPIGILNAEHSVQPGKRVYYNELRAKYGQIANLNASWGTNFADWNAVKGANILGSAPVLTPGLRADLSWLLGFYADYYFWNVQNALKEAKCPALYLGCRFALNNLPNEVLRSADKYVDVMSINLYSPTEAEWQLLTTLTKPVIVSEFAYSSTVAGHSVPLHPLEVFNEQERSVAAGTYLYRAVMNKNIVGVVWYCYADDPVTGRYYDNARWHCGLVDQTDTPYPQMIDLFKTFAKSIYTLRR